MPLNQAELGELLRKGDPTQVAAFFAKMTEAQRQPFAKMVMDWCDLLELNWRAGFSKQAEQKLAALEKIVREDVLTDAAYGAALACGSLAQIKSIGFFEHLAGETVVAILTARRPPWLDEYGEFLCQGELGRWSSAQPWRRVRTLVRAGLCQPPGHPNYSLGALEGIWPPFNDIERLRREQRGEPPVPEPSLVDQLLAERDWLDTTFWRLFEVDGTGEVSLANGDKYRKSRQAWSDAIVELSGRGVLARERLLDASLSALSRDFIQFRAGWFSRFHEALQPTPAERADRIEVYLSLLASSIPPTVAFAMDAVAIANQAKPLPAKKLLPALQPALNARGKAVVKTALQLLDLVAVREPRARREICLTAVAGLLNETTDVQKQVFSLLEKHGTKQDEDLRDRLTEVAGAVAASLRSQLKPWLETNSAGDRTGSSPEVAEGRKTKAPGPQNIVVPRTDPSRAVQPINNLDDLLHLAGSVLEEPNQPDDIERVLDAISRLCDQRPDDFDRRTGPLRKRALKKRDDMNGTLHRHPRLERALAMVLLSWIEGREKAFTEKPEELAKDQNRFQYLFRRARALAQQSASRRALPLLSAPTHRGGWIEASTLVERWLVWQRAGATPNLHEQVLALLRLAPENRDRALNSARALKGEAGQAVRLALGETTKTGGDPALWLAAWRSRQPHGDLPEFEKVHPNLGPDAGKAAQSTWRVSAERHKSGESVWTCLKFEVKTDPECPGEMGNALLPVLLHRRYEPTEEAPALRWAAQLWPANREAVFARAAGRLQTCVSSADALDRDFYPYLEPLTDPHTEMRPMACLTLAFGLAANDAALRGHAEEGLIAAITDGRHNAQELGSAMSRVFESGFNKLAHWAKSLREVARFSPAHALAAADLLQRCFHGDPAKAPRDLGKLLELLVELLSETGARLEDVKARDYLSRLTAGGKAAKLARQLLET